MGWDAWLTIAVTATVLIALMCEKPADLVFMGAIVLLALCGVIKPEEAFGGFISNSLLMVAALFVVTAGLKETGVVDVVGSRVLGPAKTELGGLIMLAIFAITTSAFLNNTPIVAMLIPLSRVVPPLYQFRVRSRIFRWYRNLRRIEDRVLGSGTNREGRQGQALGPPDPDNVAIVGHGQVGNEGFQRESLGRRKDGDLGELPLEGRALGRPQGGDDCHTVADNWILEADNARRTRHRALQGCWAASLVAHHPHQRCLGRRGPSEGDGPVCAGRVRPKGCSRRRFDPHRGVIRPPVGFGRSHLPQPSG